MKFFLLNSFESDIILSINQPTFIGKSIQYLNLTFFYETDYLKILPIINLYSDIQLICLKKYEKDENEVIYFRNVRLK